MISNPNDPGEVVRRSAEYVAERFPVELNILTGSKELRDERNRESGGQEGGKGMATATGEGGGGTDPTDQQVGDASDGDVTEAAADSEDTTEGDAEGGKRHRLATRQSAAPARVAQLSI